MPLRFRSVVPYTLPGVLALIGWWWYISRKKQRFISSPDEGPTSLGHTVSPLEGSNGLLDKGTESQTNATQSLTHTSAVVGSQEHKNIARVAPDTEAVLLQHQGSRKAFKEEHFFHESPAATLGEGDHQLEAVDHKNPVLRCSATLPSGVRDADVVVEKEEQVVSTHQAPTANSCPPSNLSDAERPEPEGEVATHYTAPQMQDKIDVQRVSLSEVDSLETPLLAQELHQCALTSTPTSAPTALAPNLPYLLGDPQEDRDLELLASGLISEVISAATQEVLGITECSQPTSSSTPLAGSGRSSTPKEHHLLASLQVSNESREAIQNGEHEVANRCFPPNDGTHQKNGALQSISLLNAKLKAGGGGVPTEDSACSTCNSSDVASSEDLHSKVEAEQETHFTERVTETAPQVAETNTAAVTALAGIEENSVEAMCEIKRLNGIGLLGNGALGTCEVETDQSGGEMHDFE